MLQYRGSIAGAAVVVALLSARPAGAQVMVVPAPGPTLSPEGWWNDLIIGVKYDVVNQAMAEWHLQQVQAKLRRDAERGDAGAVDRDHRLIDILKFRIAVDEWLIRENSLHDPGCYPMRIDAMSWAAIGQAARPQAPYPWQPALAPGPMAAPPIPIVITITNAAPAGADVAFAINGVAQQAAGGSRQELAVPPDSYLTYDGGGSLGQRRYRIGPGLYEFRSTAEGWALYKLPDMP